ncbi:MAG TPA: glycosyltransferase family 2 protein [Phycisphaerales bacterium]|nr:glycosyltransferase family 2 protein [Phycisphaerales bacterium]
MSAALLIVSLAAIVLGLYWAVMLGHVVATRVRLPTAREALRLPEATPGAQAPSLCVVVPAHNEADVIGELAASLARQDYPSFSAVFALDRCTDGTAGAIRRAIGDDPRFELVPVETCPPDWAGKVNAICTALERSTAAARAEVLVFADADTRFEPGLLRAAVALLRARGLDMVSLLSRLASTRGFERVIQPAAALELMRQYPVLRANRAERRRAFANGQFIMVRREPYERLGGHRTVHDQLFEDVHLARQAERHGLRVGVFVSGGLLHCRMYPDYAAFKRGWNRIYADAANLKPGRLRASAVRLRLVGTVLPALAAAGVVLGATTRTENSGLALWSGGLGLVAYFVALAAAYRLGGMPVATVPLYPVGAWRTASILRRAARDLETQRAVRWGGREYARAVRE